MKKRLCILFAFLISLSLVYAGETYKLDFAKSPSYIIGLKEGDRVEFEMNNSLHTIIIDKLTPFKVDLTTFTYINLNNKSNTPYYTSITSQKYMKLDIDRDSKEDLYVVYEKSNNTAALIRFQLPLLKNKNLEILPNNQFAETSYLTYLFYLLIAVIILILILYIINRVIKSKEKPEPKEQEPKEEPKEQENSNK